MSSANPTQGLFVNFGSEYDPFKPAIGSPLPADTYQVLWHKMRGFYLSRVENMPCPKRIYGKFPGQHILKSANLRAANSESTGVWLSGEKGSGKTLMAAWLSRAAREIGMPTVLVQSPFSGPQFNEFI